LCCVELCCVVCMLCCVGVRCVVLGVCCAVLSCVVLCVCCVVCMLCYVYVVLCCVVLSTVQRATKLDFHMTDGNIITRGVSYILVLCL